MVRSRLIRLVGGACVATLLALTTLFGGIASADSGGGAAVAKFDGGFVPGSFSGLGISLSGGQCINVVTPSGQALGRCHFEIPAGFAPARAIIVTGFACFGPNGQTGDSRFVATPGGQATLSCS